MNDHISGKQKKAFEEEVLIEKLQVLQERTFICLHSFLLIGHFYVILLSFKIPAVD